MRQVQGKVALITGAAEPRRQSLAARIINIGQHHLGTFGGESLRASRANTCRSTRDQRDLALNLFHCIPLKQNVPPRRA